MILLFCQQAITALIDSHITSDEWWYQGDSSATYLDPQEVEAVLHCQWGGSGAGEVRRVALGG